MRSREKRIVVNIVPNENMRIYNVNAIISNAEFESFSFPIHSCSKRNFKKIGKTGESIVKEVLGIKGCISIYIEPTRITVEKGTAFVWESIHPKIIKILKKLFGKRPIVKVIWEEVQNEE